MILFSCKDETKPKEEQVKKQSEPKLEINSFEKNLLDLKDVDLAFNESYTIKRFGAIKKNDSVFSFVLRLGDDVTKEEVKKYSIGLRSYSYELGDNKTNNLKKDFTPNLVKKKGANYIILNQKINHIRYFDSIEAYTYTRRDWNASGRISTIIIKDILLEEKNK
ncbi:hypothetical protein GCM10022271_06610 [Corallibacter vietnamensis]|uniref:Lipoprotein n=2 Tax=Corallibacter vietnamensis TaxID=904130 RepID=A0ABP7GYH3_9FLAO